MSRAEVGCPRRKVFVEPLEAGLELEPQRRAFGDRAPGIKAIAEGGECLAVALAQELEGAGFGHQTNQVTIIDSNNNIDKFELKTKDEVASDILKKIIGLTR